MQDPHKIMSEKPDGRWRGVQKHSQALCSKLNVFTLSDRYIQMKGGKPAQQVFLFFYIPFSMWDTHIVCYTAKLRTTSGLCFKEQRRVGSALTDMLVPIWHTFLNIAFTGMWKLLEISHLTLTRVVSWLMNPQQLNAALSTTHLKCKPSSESHTFIKWIKNVLCTTILTT